MEMKESKVSTRIALPVSNGRLCPHFGHCEAFALLDVDIADRTIANSAVLASPGHQPGVLPAWLHQQGVNAIITGGMGARAIEMFMQYNIKVIMGVADGTPEELVKNYMEGSLNTGENVCNHDEQHGPGGHQCRH